MIAPTFFGMEPTAVHQQLLAPQEVAAALDDIAADSTDSIVQTMAFNGTRYRVQSAVYRRPQPPESQVASIDPSIDTGTTAGLRGGAVYAPTASASLLPDFDNNRTRLWVSNLLMLLGAGSMIAAVSMFFGLLRELRREA